jgi:hypothetical protein
MEIVGLAMQDVVVNGELAEDGHSALRRRALDRFPAWMTRIVAWEVKTGNRSMRTNTFIEAN